MIRAFNPDSTAPWDRMAKNQRCAECVAAQKISCPTRNRNYRIELLILEYRLLLRTALPFIQFYPSGEKINRNYPNNNQLRRSYIFYFSTLMANTYSQLYVHGALVRLIHPTNNKRPAGRIFSSPYNFPVTLTISVY